MRVRLLPFAIILVLGMNASAMSGDRSFGDRFEASLSIQETLEIAADNASADTVVRLLLRGGGSLEGAVQAHRPDKASVALLHANGWISIVSLGEIAAVTLLDPGAARRAFQGNRIFMEAGDDVVTLLAFRRQIRDLSTRAPVAVHAQFGDDEIREASCRFYAIKILEALRNAIDRTLVDDMGRAAFSAVDDRVRVVTAPESSLDFERDGADLKLQFDCRTPLDADYAERIGRRLAEIL